MKRLAREKYKQVEDVLPPTWNIAPSRPAWVVRGVGGELEPSALKWGFKDGNAAPGLAPINARVETAATRFLFRDAGRKRSSPVGRPVHPVRRKIRLLGAAVALPRSFCYHP